jgi:hypothetical protein
VQIQMTKRGQVAQTLDVVSSTSVDDGSRDYQVTLQDQSGSDIVVDITLASDPGLDADQVTGIVQFAQDCLDTPTPSPIKPAPPIIRGGGVVA